MFNTVPTFNLDKLENVKSAVEHVGLYVGLVIFTAAGAKVKSGFFNGRYNGGVSMGLMGSVEPINF